MVKFVPKVVGLAVVAVVAVVAIVVTLGAFNPFRSVETDRSSASLVTSIVDMSRLTAATGNFQAVIDIERDTPYVPDFLSGERLTLLAVASVDAYVELGGLPEDAVQVAPDGRSVVITVPAPVLGEPRFDFAQSRLIDHDRGLAERVEDTFGEGSDVAVEELYARAAEKIAADAAGSDLRARAEASARATLVGLAERLGFAEVEVRFAAAPVTP